MTLKDLCNECRWFYQRGKRGYSDRDIWSLDFYLGSWLPQAIRQLADKKIGHPIEKGMTNKKWKRVLYRMAEGFEDGYRLQNECPNIVTGKKWGKSLKLSLTLFSKYYINLWD